MARRLFLILLASFIGVATTPNFLIADQIPKISSPDFNATETIPIQPKIESKAEPKPATKPQSTPKTAAQPQKTTTTKQAIYTPPKLVNYTVSHYVSNVNEYSSTYANLSYSKIYRFKKMIYGHNTPNLLGNLSKRTVGEHFTITESGATKTYKVAKIVTYRKTSDNHLENNQQIMNDIAYRAMGYDVALLTCAGKSVGKGDATHRLVVFANQI